MLVANVGHIPATWKLRYGVALCNMESATTEPPLQPPSQQGANLMDIDFTQYDPNDSGDYEALMEIIADNPGEEYDWEKLADYGIEHAWAQFVWGWDDEPEETPHVTTREFTYSNR